MPLLGLFENVVALIVNGLAVAGAFLAGMFLTAALLWLVCRSFFKKQPPAPVAQFIRALGGVAFAALVAALLFGSKQGGGSNPFGRTGGPNPTAPAGPEATAPTRPDTRPEPTKPAATKLEADPVRAVTMLGGDRVREGRFYRAGPGNETFTFEELRERLRSSALPKGQDGRPQLDILIYEDSVAEGTRPVARLREWAQSANVVVSVKRLPGRVP